MSAETEVHAVSNRGAHKSGSCRFGAGSPLQIGGFTRELGATPG